MWQGAPHFLLLTEFQKLDSFGSTLVDATLSVAGFATFDVAIRGHCMPICQTDVRNTLHSYIQDTMTMNIF